MREMLSPHGFRHRLWAGAIAALVLVAGGGAAIFAQRPAAAAPVAPAQRSVPGRPLAPAVDAADPEARSVGVGPAPHWPDSGRVDLTVPPGHTVRAGTLPVDVTTAPGTGPAVGVRVELLDQASVHALGGVVPRCGSPAHPARPRRRPAR